MTAALSNALAYAAGYKRSSALARVIAQRIYSTRHRMTHPHTMDAAGLALDDERCS